MDKSELNRSLLRSDPLVVVMVLLLIGWSWFQFDKDDSAAAKTPIDQKGQLLFDEKFFDFGVLTEGDVVRHNFKFRNSGTGAFRLAKIETSCGCTTTNDAVLKSYAPGESGELDVVVDTVGKKGIVVKTVTLITENNDVEKIELSLAMQLQPPPHPVIGEPRNINREDACKSCHLLSAEGQSGIFLYHRVCSQCHGKKGVGGFGPALTNPVYHGWPDAQFRQVIHQGRPEKGMPSFVDEVTPPLTGEQVESLIGYIRSLSENQDERS